MSKIMKFRQKSVIVDIDGTIADLSHRLHHIEGEAKNWVAFHAGVFQDEPIDEVIQLINGLSKSGYYIILMTGRSDSSSIQTQRWMQQKAGCRWNLLLMREYGNYEPDIDLKLRWLKMLYDGQIAVENVDPPKLAFEDRAHMTVAFREKGLKVMHVAEGNY
jgi:hypothetical protein